jgi:hypothetical protein
MVDYLTKVPDALLDYTINWDDGYLAAGEELVSSACEWEITPDGITSTDDDVTIHTHTIWLNGGTHGVVYTLTSKVLTTEGRRDERCLYVKVWEGK